MMSRKPKVSVLTTCFNREKYLTACIDSVLASSYHDWELIIVDDVSTDTSVAIAKSYEKKDARIKVYVNAQNLGDYPNRNKAASYAKGTYLKYLDADDIIYPRGLEVMVHAMEQFPEAGLGISQKVVEDVKPYPFVMQPKETFKREFLMRGVLGVPPTQTILRAEIFREFGGFTGTRYIGDTELWYKIACFYPTLKMSPDLVCWREHDNQEFKKGMSSHSYLKNNFKNVMNALNFDACPLDSCQIQIAKKKYNQRFARDILRLLVIERKFIKANIIRKSCRKSWFQIIKSV